MLIQSENGPVIQSLGEMVSHLVVVLCAHYDAQCIEECMHTYRSVCVCLARASSPTFSSTSLTLGMISRK